MVLTTAPVSDIHCTLVKYGYFIDNFNFSHFFDTPLQKGVTMLDLLKKGMLAGLGIAVLTREKIRESTRMLVEEGKISSDEADKLAEDLVKSGEREWSEISSKMQSSFKKISGNLEMVRQKDFADLKTRVEIIEERLSRLEDRGKGSGAAGL
jgi:polyhydroxyalkanoate synthesis regulator phasin